MPVASRLKGVGHQAGSHKGKLAIKTDFEERGRFYKVGPQPLNPRPLARSRRAP